MTWKSLLDALGNDALVEARWMIQGILEKRFNRFGRTHSSSPVEAKTLADVNTLTESNLEAFLETSLTPIEKARALGQFRDRALFKPLQYIIGNVPFCGLSVTVHKPVLIPRWETEEWTMALIERLKHIKKPRVLDLCSGSGCISLAMARHLNARVLGMDVSPKALALSRINARRLSLDVDYILGDITQPLSVLDSISKWSTRRQVALGFDVIVSNPPYIPLNELNTLENSVKDWEDHLALFAHDPKGLFFYHHLASLFPRLNSPLMVLEIGMGQANDVSSLFARHDVDIQKDLAGIPRSLWISNSQMKND